MSKKEHNLTIIDADSLIYIIGASLDTVQLEPLGIMKLDEFIGDILIATKAKRYIGYFGGKGGKNFRYAVAVTKPYKGNRKKEKPEWFEFWEPVLKAHMENVWRFQPVLNVEADDACTIAANKYRGKYAKITIASPDKDLRQLGDMHFYDYGKQTENYISNEEGMRRICSQLITGRMLPV